MAAPRPGPPRPQSDRVDTRQTASVSFVSPGIPASAAGQPMTGQRVPAAGPGRPTIAPPTHVPRNESDVNAFPIHVSKVQRPALPDETLARDRLLDWLHAKIHHRLVLVTAEAGYGKTTLLADFARRTRLRTLWYRLDESDRDWVTVLHYLVAAGREVDPDFASTTWSLLGELGSGGSSRDAIVATFVRELQSIGEHGAVLVLDHYHAVDDAPALQPIVREVVNHAPERLTIVLLSRRAPTLPIA